MNLNETFWDNKYKANQIGWDLGEIATPIKEYIDQLTDKNLKILIPGGGNSYEAAYLYEKGFKNVFVVDISKTALENLKKRVETFPSNQLLHQNFFDIDTTFDLVLEQTYFCALDPKLRSKYASKMSEIIASKGKLVGVLFKVPLNNDHPPFGGNAIEYKKYFTPFFAIKVMDNCYNSVKSRAQKELFITLIKK